MRINEDIAVLVVLFNPGEDFKVYLNKILDIFNLTILIDNAPLGSKSFSMLSDVGGLLYLPMAKNQGLGYAINRGCDEAFSRGYNYVITFDQDTRVIDSFPSYVCSAINWVNNGALVGPSYGAVKKGSRGDDFQLKKTIISSGMIVSKKLYNAIGRFREDYFIDSIDHEYCLRARSRGFLVLQWRYVAMNHAIGSGTHLIPKHDYLRKYSIFRNVLATVFQYWRSEPIWCIKQIFRLNVELCSIVFFEDDKIRKIKSIFWGVKHAFQGVFVSPVGFFDV